MFLDWPYLKFQVFWNVTMCHWVDSSWHFGELQCLYAQGQAATPHELLDPSCNYEYVPSDTVWHPRRVRNFSSTTVKISAQTFITFSLFILLHAV